MLFALSVIVSHYSTNFVLLVLVAFVTLSTLLLSHPFVKKTLALLVSTSPIKPKNTFPNHGFLSLPLLLLLVSMTYVWNNVYTQTSNHSGSVIAEVVGGFFVQSNIRSNDLAYSIFFAPKTDPLQGIQGYINRIRQSENVADTYPQSITKQYPTYALPQEQIAPTPVGNALSSLHVSVFGVQAELRSLSASCMQIFVLLGLLALFFVKHKKPFDLQYLLLCFGALFLLALITLLPDLSLEYGVLRMFQQLLFVISLPIVLGLSAVLFFVREQRRILCIGIIAIFFFLNVTGFLSHLTKRLLPSNDPG